MLSKEIGNHVVLKLTHGEDLFSSLEKAAEKHKMDSAIVLCGIGMLQEFELSFFDLEKKKYETIGVKEACELVSMAGSLTFAENGEFMPHLHVGVAGRDHSLKGGHLKKAKVAVLNEIILLKLPEKALTRKLNSRSNLYELSFS
ncbi:MAG TPA: DUF296 domain-containing protein [Thermoplasmata archaeon]|nr:DUF296 domain-containing protein [Thermoplasmata archaeon]